MSAASPTNVPCARCGAPMRPMREPGTDHLAASVIVTCDCCGASERLPADASERVLAVCNLLVQRQWAQDAACGPALAYLKLMETSKTVMMPYAFGAMLVVATVLRAPASPYTMIPIGVIGGAAVATYLAYRVARRRLRATVGPLIRSFPGVAGQPQRCRRCGGELPAMVVAFVECEYCRAPNLASHAVASEHAAALRAQAGDARLYAGETAAQVASVGRFASRLFIAGFFAGAGLGAIAAIALS